MSGQQLCRVLKGAPAALPLLCLVFAANAEARIQCAYTGPPQNLLTVSATGEADAVIRRAGDDIVVREFLGGAKKCSGDAPTVFNTDAITVAISGALAAAELDLGGGVFAPGATPEAEGVPEIEVEFRGRVIDPRVIGTPAADEFQWAPGGANAGLNVNPVGGDEDVDVTLRGRYSFMLADGGKGGDRIVPAPGARIHGPLSAFSVGGPGDDVLGAPAPGAVMQGGPGDDILTGSRARDGLYGGQGDDRLTGGGGSDMLVGGRGRDVLLGGPGRDDIGAHDHNHGPDIVKCGSGRDRVIADPSDRLRGCELIRH